VPPCYVLGNVKGFGYGSTLGHQPRNVVGGGNVHSLRQSLHVKTDGDHCCQTGDAGCAHSLRGRELWVLLDPTLPLSLCTL